MTSRSYGALVGLFELFLFPNVIMIASLGKNLQLSVQTLFFNLFPMIVKRPLFVTRKVHNFAEKKLQKCFCLYSVKKSMCTLPSPLNPVKCILHFSHFIFNLLSFLTSPCIPTTILERKRGKKCCGQMVWSVKKTKQVCCCCGLSNLSVFIIK